MQKLIVLCIFLFSSLYAQEEVHYKYVNVTHSKPVCEEIEVVKPHRHSENCYEEYRVQKPRYNRTHSDENSIGIDTIVGVASGVILGSQIGKGNGRTAAQVVGGLLGGTVANKIRNYNHVDDYSDDYYYETKRRNVCNDHYQTTHTKRVLKGYKNYFNYNGKRYHKFSKRPLHEVRVTKTISF